MKCFKPVWCLLEITAFLIAPNDLPAAESAGSGAAVRWHFRGFDHLGRGNDATTLLEVWKLPASAALRQQALPKIARMAAAALKPENPMAAEAGAFLIQPMLDDLLRSESHGQLRLPADGAPVLSIGIRLDEQRAAAWNASLRRASGSAGQGQPGSKVWTAPDGDRIWRFHHEGSWVNLEVTFGKASSDSKNTTVLAPPETAADTWLKLEADLQLLKPWLPELGLGALPSVDLALKPRGDSVRTETRLRFAAAKQWPVARWQIPSHLIRDPLISFTALQGASNLLNRFTLLRELGIKPSPDQLFIWGNSPDILLQIQAASPVKNSAAAMREIIENRLPAANAYLEKNAAGQIRRAGESGVIWGHGMPQARPLLQPASGTSGEFLVLKLFPLANSPFTNAAPAELFAQVTSRTNLLYYDWEITQPRLIQLWDLNPVVSITSTIPPLSTNMTAGRWLLEIAPKLGNTTTEVTVGDARELNLVRKSHIGLNGVELMALATWLESPRFPKADFEFGFRPVPTPLRRK